MGNVERAEELPAFITDSAVDNDHLIPELFDPNDGRYEGVVPWLAMERAPGKWRNSKYGMPFPDVDVGWGQDAMPEGGTAGDENMGVWLATQWGRQAVLEKQVMKS